MFGVGNLGAGFGQIPGAGTAPVSIATNSLIFTAASSQYLTATGKITINQQKFTFAFWMKTSSAVAATIIDFSDGTTANRVEVNLLNGGAVGFSAITATVIVGAGTSTATFNDSAWHHFVVAVDTTQATAANRIIIYADGAVAALSASTYPTQNTLLSNNLAATYDIGSRNGTSRFLNGNLAQVYYIDGQQLTPSSFITGTPGVPKTYSGAYSGTFDFFLPFSNGTSTTTLGADGSGEGNNWTLNAMTTANQSADHP